MGTEVKDIKLKVLDKKGKESGTLSLDPRVFAAPIRPQAVQQVVRWQLAKRRAGTHAVLNRSKMEGGGRKPFKQKGTGNARAGSRRSPLWRGGAVIHGPQPRSYEFKVTKSTRAQAFASVLSDKVRSNSLVLVDDLEIETGKTKDVSALLKALKLDQAIGATGIAMVCEAKDSEQGLIRGAKNLPKVKTLSVAGANVYDLVNAGHLVVSKESVIALQDRLLGSKDKREKKAKAEDTAA